MASVKNFSVMGFNAPMGGMMRSDSGGFVPVEPGVCQYTFFVSFVSRRTRL
ncbi:MAG: hypothetical protein H7Y38_02360 [Armatimonadetes bacterium]|nr:hypothetical protein [Armatimonadota bacterium]